MRGNCGPLGRRCLPLGWALLVQLAAVLAGAALLLLGAGAGWLLVLLVASLVNMVAAACCLRGGSAAPTPAPEPTPTESAAAPLKPGSPSSDQVRRRLQSLEDDLARREQRMTRLAAGRDRAREESRLKSDYLILLSREMRPLRQRVSDLLDSAEDETQRRGLAELSDRLGDLDVLLEGIAGVEPEPDASPPPHRKRVLIVDDGPVNLMLACQVLERQGIEVRTATSGPEALASLEQNPFDLVLMDIFMPGMDGMETSRRWRKVELAHYPGHQSVLVALTANASAEDRERFVAAGLDDYLAKPYRPQQLVDLIERWLPPSSEEASPP